MPTIDPTLVGLEGDFETDGSSGNDIHTHCIDASELLRKNLTDQFPLAQTREVIRSFDAISPVFTQENEDIKSIIDTAREELLDAFLANAAGRTRVACAMLRGVMEGFFTALFYRQQSLSLNLWASGKTFHMVHSLLDDKHEFRLYYHLLFKDDRFAVEFPGVTSQKVFDEARDLYDVLSGSVHKKRTSAGSESLSFHGLVERVFRISICFVEREDDLPALRWPSPASFASWVLEQAPKKTRGK